MALPLVTRLNETELQQLAGATKGIYVKLNEVDEAVNAITKQLSTIETTTLDDNAFRITEVISNGFWPWPLHC